MAYCYKTTLSYRGGNFCGWQTQPEKRTVQGVMTEAAEKVLGDGTTVTGCSRTDSGVHAKGFVALIKAEKEIEPSQLVRALNANLPDDVAVTSCETAEEDFHPRYSVKAKTYEYVIYDGEREDPFENGLSCRYRHRIDEKKLNEEAAYVIGRQDFRAFMAAGSKVTDTVRTVYECEVRREGDRVYIRITGDGFLYNMVRIIAGTLVMIWEKGLPSSEMAEIISSCDRSRAGMTFPPEGLYLMKVTY